MTQTSDAQEPSSWEAFQEDVQVEYEKSQRALTEIRLMLEQSQAELNKLTQRNATITVQLQQVQSTLDTLPRADIRLAYDAALDAQHRLFVMRGQLEKLQSDESHLEKYVQLLETVQNLTGIRKPEEPEVVAPPTASSNVEMIINAQEAERQRLSRQMHDGPAQALSNFILQTEIALRLFDIDQGRAREELNALKLSAMNTFQKVRNFIFELRPMMLDDLGLIPTIKRYADTFKEQSGMEISVVVTGMEKRFEPYLEVMIFRALQELLGNAARHSQANQVKVLLNIDDSSVRVTVDDNGKGFNSNVLQTGNGLGLKLIRDRVEMLGGTFFLDTAEGKGARVVLDIPIAKDDLAEPEAATASQG
ncbi:MAG TPA: sensor histidine kinase [Anaerolineaceae bacterium]|nr:sensor histidine kinase [Anaerolineaceae bacterium]